MIRYVFPESQGESHAEWQLKQDAHAHRLKQVEAIFELFRRATGHMPQTMAELEAWAVTADFQKPIDPYPILRGEA